MKKISFRLISAFLAVVILLSPVMAAEEEKTVQLEWNELAGKIKEGNLTFLALDKSISGIETVDYTSMYNSLRSQLRDISNAQSFMFETGDYGALNSLNASIVPLRETYEDLRDGKPQRDSENAAKQLRDAQNQVIAGAQSLYINILAMEQSLIDGERGIAAMERSLSELRLRRAFGQVSDMAVEELLRTRDNTRSALSSLENTVFLCKAQLQLLMGEEADGEISLGELPSPEKKAAELDVEKDLAVAKEKSLSIENAKYESIKAQENVKDIDEEYRRGEVQKYQLTIAQKSADAAELSYNSAIRSFELSFREAHRAIADAEQVLENKKAAVEHQKKKTELSAKQFELGRISYFAYLTAQETLQTAQSEVESAERELFAALNKYNNAVAFGIL